MFVENGWLIYGDVGVVLKADFGRLFESMAIELEANYER